jgi:hypothetical protein
MMRERKPVQLQPIDEDAENPLPVIRLENQQTAKPEPDEKSGRLARHADASAASQRLALPSRENAVLRSHQPGIEAIVATAPINQNLPEQNWGSNSSRHNPIPWGWFALIGLAITGAVVWSLNRVDKAEVKADQIRRETHSSLVGEATNEREANQLIDRIDKTLRDFFDTDSVDTLAKLVRQPERVTPLMRQYYSNKPVFSARVRTIKTLRPLTLDNRGNFWMTSIVLSNDQTRHLLLEILASGEARIDWETMVCFQPMKWDDFAVQRPPGKSLDFRVYVERDSLYSHEFMDATRWVCFRLTAQESEETLFGYAPAKSEIALTLIKLLKQNPKHKAALILRLGSPAALQSRRGVVIEKLINERWLYLDPPEADS